MGLNTLTHHDISPAFLVAFNGVCGGYIQKVGVLDNSNCTCEAKSELISNCHSFPGNGYQPYLTTLTHLGRPQWNAVCICLMSVAILE